MRTFKFLNGELYYEVVRRIGNITDSCIDNPCLHPELNLISWNACEPKYDIRWFSKNRESLTFGITLTKEEAKILSDLLSEYFSVKEGAASSWPTIEFENEFVLIKDHLGTLTEYQTGWAKELNICRFKADNGKSFYFDIRDFDADRLHCSKGLSLTEEEAFALSKLLEKEFACEPTSEEGASIEAVASAFRQLADDLESIGDCPLRISANIEIKQVLGDK